MIWRWTFRTVIAGYLVVIAWMLSETFPRFFMNPALGIIALIAFGLLMIFKPWREPEGQEELHTEGRCGNLTSR